MYAHIILLYYKVFKKVIPVHVISIVGFTTNCPFDTSSQGSDDLSGVIVFAASAKNTAQINTHTNTSISL